MSNLLYIHIPINIHTYKVMWQFFGTNTRCRIQFESRKHLTIICAMKVYKRDSKERNGHCMSAPNNERKGHQCMTGTCEEY